MRMIKTILIVAKIGKYNDNLLLVIESSLDSDSVANYAINLCNFIQYELIRSWIIIATDVRVYTSRYPVLKIENQV